MVPSTAVPNALKCRSVQNPKVNPLWQRRVDIEAGERRPEFGQVPPPQAALTLDENGQCAPIGRPE